MTKELNKLGMEAFKIKDWKRSIGYFLESLKIDAYQAHIHYMNGQAYRFLENFPEAVKHLKSAVELDETYKEWFLALGIALQLDEQLEESIDAFRQANLIDQDYHLPYNSAAISFRKMGDFKKAIEVYDQGIIAFIRNFLSTYENNRKQKIYKHTNVGTDLYLKYSMEALVEHGVRFDTGYLLFPTPEMAMHEMETREHEGLMWVKKETKKGDAILYLPNCFDTIRAYLASDSFYCMALENRTTAMQELGDTENLEDYLKEAKFFRTWYETR